MTEVEFVRKMYISDVEGLNGRGRDRSLGKCRDRIGDYMNDRCLGRREELRWQKECGECDFFCGHFLRE